MKKTFKTKEEAIDFKYKKLDECNKKKSISVIIEEVDGKYVVEWSFFKIKQDD